MVIRFLLPLLLAALFLGSPQATPKETDLLIVMTYNIRYGVGMDGRLDIERIARVIEESGADIVVLQEVDRLWGERSGHQDQMALLEKRLGFFGHYGPTLHRPRLPRLSNPRVVGQYGNAILSRYPIRSARSQYISPSIRFEPRGLVEVVVDHPWGPVTVLGTHLSLNESQRLREIEILLGRAQLGEGLVLVAGDFNIGPNTPEIQSMNQAGFIDAQAVRGLADPTFPSDRPRAKIDYIFLPQTESHRVHGAHVIPTQASDHLPFVAVFTRP